MKSLTSITVLADSREQIPLIGPNLLFPEYLEWVPFPGERPRQVRVKVVKRKMDAGDYAIEGHEGTVIMERKGSLRELHTNLLTDDRARFTVAIEKLASSCAYPYLLLDCTPWEMYTKSDAVTEPWKVFDHLSQVVHRYGLRLLYVGGCSRPARRRILGEQMVRLMMAHCFDPIDAMDRTEINKVLGIEEK